MRIILFAASGLGNLLLRSPLIGILKREYPNAKIDLLCRTLLGLEMEMLFAGDIDEVIHNKSGHLNFREILKIRRKKYDVAILPFDCFTLKNLFLVIFSCAKYKVIHINLYQSGFKDRFKVALALFPFLGLTLVPVLGGRHEIHLNIDLIDSIRDKPVQRDFTGIVRWRIAESTVTLPKSRYIVLQLSASNGSGTSKTWAPKNFVHLIERVKEKYNQVNILLVGDAGDLASLGNLTLNQSCINLLGTTTFNDLCKIICGAEVVVAHDSGIMHLADFLGVPTIALYGPTDLERTRPSGKNSRYIQSQNECTLAMYMFRNSENILNIKYPKYYCMSGITVNDVFREIDSNLSAIDKY